MKKSSMRWMVNKVVLIVLSFLLIFTMGAQVEAAGIQKAEIKTVKVTGAGRVNLTWSKSSGVNGYEIYQSTNKSKGFKKVQTVKKASTTSTRIEGLDGGKKYYFKVRAYKKVGKKTKRSAFSKVKGVTIVGLATVSPNTKPYYDSYKRKSAYNKSTKQYFMLQSYLEYMEKCGGGTLTLKAGTYNIPGTLYIPSNTKIVLSDGTIINKTNDAGKASSVVSNRLFVFVEKAKKDKSNCVSGYKGAHDITILGQGKTQINTKTEGSAILSLAHNKNIKISGVQFGLSAANCKAVSIMGCSNVTVEKCSFSSTKSGGCGVYVDIPSSKAKQTLKWARFDDTVCNKIKVNQCSFTSLDDGVASNRFMKGKYHTEVSVTSCKFKKIKSDAIRMMNWANPVVTKCEFDTIGEGAVVGTKTLAVGIRMYGCQKPQITQNSFNNAERSIYIGYRENADSALKSQGNTVNSISESTVNAMLKNNTIKKMGDYFISWAVPSEKDVRCYWFADNTKNYTMTADQSPYRNQFVTYKNYNSSTRQYYVMRSYLEQMKRNGGGTLTLEAGSYKFFQTITLPSNVKIVFKDGVKITCTPGIALFTMVDPADSDAGVKYKGYNGVHDVSIEGPATGSAVIDVNYSENAAMILLHSKNITIKNITFKNMNGSKNHFIEVNGSNNVCIENNIFTGCKYSAGKSCKEAINIDLPDINTGGIDAKFTTYDCTPDNGVVIRNNTFKNVPVAVGSHNYTPGKKHKGISVTGNKMYNMDYTAVRAMNWDAPVICNNIIDNIGSDSYGQAIWLQGVNTPKISGNKVNKAVYFVQTNVAEYNEINIDKTNPNYNKLYGYDRVLNAFSESDAGTIGLYNNTLTAVDEFVRHWIDETQRYEIWELR